MKTSKILKRIAKIEALISKVTERSSASAPNIRELLEDAKAAVVRAKKAVEASSVQTKKAPMKDAKKSNATPEQSKPKRKLSAAGRKAISEATKKRWAAKKAAAIVEPAVARKSTAKGLSKRGTKTPQKKAKVLPA